MNVLMKLLSILDRDFFVLFESCGGVSNDVHRLDRDNDGLACENLP